MQLTSLDPIRMLKHFLYSDLIGQDGSKEKGKGTFKKADDHWKAV